MAQLVDQYGQPINFAALKREQAVPSVQMMRVAIAGHPSTNLTPERMGAILRASEDSDPMSYLELAEEMEEKDLHYLGVLGTRKRAVAQLDISVEAATDKAEDIEKADLVRSFVNRLELEDELFDVLDAIGKGYSACEIIWDVSEKQWMPQRIEYRDPRWFRDDGTGRLALRAGAGTEPLWPYKFIVHRARAKSGTTIRGGLARAVAWSWMFKNFAVKDWVIFAEAYGQPIRIGKYGPGANEFDKAVLRDALALLASDCAAIIPQSMEIDFKQAETAKSTDLYERMCDWLDRQISKAVLGQTATTDAIKGGYAVGRVHDGVRADIEASDAKALASTLNKCLVRPLVDLNHGPQKAYPVLRIGRGESVEIEKVTNALDKLVPLGLKVSMAEVRDKLGFADPAADEETLRPAANAGGSEDGAAYAIGDRVKVKPGSAHDEMTKDKAGTIKEVNGTAYGVLFDGMPGIHRWYVADELEPAAALNSEDGAAYAIGDRVKVKPGSAHDEMTKDKAGTIKEVNGTAYGVLFDGMPGIHRWYVADELEPADAETPAQPKKKMPEMPEMAAQALSDDDIDQLAQRLDGAAMPAMGRAIDQIRALLMDGSITTLDQLAARLIDLYPGLDFSEISERIAEALLTANLAGQDEVENG